MTYALDTSIVIDIINGEQSVLSQFRLAVKEKMSMTIPIVVDYEVCRGFRHTENIRSTPSRLKSWISVVLKHAAGMFYETAPLGRFAALANPSIKQGCCSRENTYRRMRLHCPVVEVDAKMWDSAAYVWATLRKTGQTIGDADILIAALCIERGYTLVTHNVKHFSTISNLRMEEWA